MRALTSYCHFPAWPVPFHLDLPFEPEADCPYLPTRRTRYRAFAVDALPGHAYQQLMDAGFRRSGHLLYQPACCGCRSCVPIRVPVREFLPSASQRRCARRNADLILDIGRPFATVEKLNLYNRYNVEWHAGSALTLEEFIQAFYASCVDTIEFTYRAPNGELLAAGLCDVTPQALSSVYFYFAPGAAARGLGTYGILREIEFAAAQPIPYYYLGYWVAGCGAMSYKANFGPHQLLDSDGQWRPAPGGRQPPLAAD